MFQFNFRAGIIRLAIRPILKIFLLTGSWKNSYKTAPANLRSLWFLFCSLQSNVQVCRHPTASYLQGWFFPPATALLLLVICTAVLGKDSKQQGSGLQGATSCLLGTALQLPSSFPNYQCQSVLLLHSHKWHFMGLLGKQSIKKYRQLQMKKAVIKQEQVAGSCFLLWNISTALL